MTEQKSKEVKTQISGYRARMHTLELNALYQFDDAVFEMPIGGVFTLEIVEMTKDEFNALDGWGDNKWENK